MKPFIPTAALPFLLLAAPALAQNAPAPRSVSGIYPHLAYFNNEGECGTGAVVPWADRLWVITYGPHLPLGSSDKLYEITPDLQQIIRPESVGGTPANRMIHRESNQLVIGPYFIDDKRNVRAIPPKLMPGRHTGNARHLTDPAGKIYFATMEEGLYEVDVKTLEVTGHIKDGNGSKSEEKKPATLDSKLPGYHGKGLFSGQGRLVYANNGERDPRLTTDPTIPSGALGEWRKPGDDWQLVRRNQFTEVTGPGGIFGATNPATDPIWSVGWDSRSLILMCLDNGKWHSYRLPKGSHSYDGAHGWNTEWPRIRDIGENDLLMTMHGTFWKFPKTFSATNSAGIAPRSNYLKVIGDFTRWNDKVVFGCDDTAKSEFLNKRKAKGGIVGPGRSQSNLWFVEPSKIDNLGPVIGRGAVWLNDDVKAGEVSEPYLFAGYTHRMLHLSVGGGDTPVPGKSHTFTLEVDKTGNGTFTKLRDVTLAANGSTWLDFKPAESGAWLRLKSHSDSAKVTALFQYRNAETRPATSAPLFDGLAKAEAKNVSGGLLFARGADFKNLRFLASDAGGELGTYDLGADLKLVKANDPAGAEWMKKNVAIPQDVLKYDAASVLYEDAKGRWRLPKADGFAPLGDERICREVCTERDLFNAGGIFYELPSDNAGGTAKIRPVTTHNRRIKDYASYRGMLVLSGVENEAKSDHIVRSDDGKCALWVGAVDDLWQFGKPRGIGGPWKDSDVKAGVPSDPFLMTGFDKKRVTLTSNTTTKIRLEVDFSGTGTWTTYANLAVEPGKPLEHIFPDAFSAYWVRAVADADCKASVIFTYE